MKPATLMERRALIIQTCRPISDDLCRKVFAEARFLLEEVLRQDGGHVERNMHYKRFSILVCCSECAICNIFLQNVEAKTIHAFQHFVRHSVAV